MSSHVDNVLIDEIVPRLRHLIPHHVPRVGSEDPEELLQDATLIAARLLIRARANGKTVTPGNIAYYTLLHLRSGRRSHSASRSDAMGSRTQLVGHSRVDSLADAVGGPDAEEPLTLGDVLASDTEDPSQTAARNLDWQALVATLDEWALAVLHCLADEVRLQEVATQHGVSRSTVQGWRNRLTELVRSFLGADVLHLIQRTPQWRENLTALREQLACRGERRLAA
ncbi:MAG: hypothetical protein EB141_11355 [Verrucomicrobia bacterium]|nr:hypothetical protein [Verrucomicrobiota bacterium]NDD39322.1 hypothetical protein [Verrucomicrobiota bacterium]